MVTASYDMYWALERRSWCPDFIRRRYIPYVVRPAPATLRTPQTAPSLTQPPSTPSASHSSQKSSVGTDTTTGSSISSHSPQTTTLPGNLGTRTQPYNGAYHTLVRTAGSSSRKPMTRTKVWRQVQRRPGSRPTGSRARGISICGTPGTPCGICRGTHFRAAGCSP